MARWRLQHGGREERYCMAVNIECCRTECSEVNGQCEVTGGIAIGDSVLGRGLDID